MAATRVQDVATHRFRLGQRVSWHGPAGSAPMKPNVAEVVRQLPPLGSDFQYRIKAADGSREHVATERELSPIASTVFG